MKTIRILTIGNSFSDNALEFLEAIGQGTSSVRFQVGRANLGGCSLEKHWNLADYTARHREHKSYHRVTTSADGTPVAGSLQDALVAEPWDFVTLQQVSCKSWQPETVLPHLGLLHGLVRQRAPQARILLHQTWAYREDSPFLPENGLTQELMFERIKATYAHYAAKLGCGVLPSGEAVQRARRTPGRAFAWPEADFDYQHAEAPALPRQEHSLSAGWYWDINNSAEGIPELRLDATHLNAHGCYLVGCLWFACLTGEDARNIRFAPASIAADTAAFYRTVAHETCTGHGAGE